MKRAIAILFLVFILSGCNLVFYAAEYTVSGTVTHADIVFKGSSHFNESLPWTSFEEYERKGHDFYLSAQSNDVAGDLTVALTLDGAPFMSETTSVPFGFVAIYGEIP